MEYKVLTDFVDIATGKEYHEGDKFETEGVTADKLYFLSHATKDRKALIEAEEATEEAEAEKTTEDGEPETTDEGEGETTEDGEPQGV